MPKRSRIGLDRLIAAAGRGAGGIAIGKGEKVADPTTEALIAECEAQRLKVKLADEQAEHYKAEAVRLAELLQDAQAQAEETDALNFRLQDLLVNVANALKGPPPDLGWHDWSDLPTVAANLASKARHLQGEIQRRMKEPDQHD